MALTHSVLALLARGDNYGYNLRTQFEVSYGPHWGYLNIGHVYQLLDRLERDGLVATRRIAQSSKPDRLVYSLTDSGRAELEAWFAEPVARTRGYRDEFFLKLIAAAADHERLAALIEAQRTMILSELRALADLRPTVAEVSARLLVEAAEAHLVADMRFLDRVEESASSLVAESKALSSTGQADDTSSDPRRNLAG